MADIYPFCPKTVSITLGPLDRTDDFHLLHPVGIYPHPMGHFPERIEFHFVYIEQRPDLISF